MNRIFEGLKSAWDNWHPFSKTENQVDTKNKSIALGAMGKSAKAIQSNSQSSNSSIKEKSWTQRLFGSLFTKKTTIVASEHIPVLIGIQKPDYVIKVINLTLGEKQEVSPSRELKEGMIVSVNGERWEISRMQGQIDDHPIYGGQGDPKYEICLKEYRNEKFISELSCMAEGVQGTPVFGRTVHFVPIRTLTIPEAQQDKLSPHIFNGSMDPAKIIYREEGDSLSFNEEKYTINKVSITSIKDSSTINEFQFDMDACQLQVWDGDKLYTFQLERKE